MILKLLLTDIAVFATILWSTLLLGVNPVGRPASIINSALTVLLVWGIVLLLILVWSH